MHPYLSRLLRSAIGLIFIIAAAVSFARFPIPRFAFTGLLGVINEGIIAYLLVLTIRHFLIVYLAACEAVRREHSITSNDLPKISVIVPGYNEEVVIARTIRSLQSYDYPDLEILVIDDGSKDQTLAVATAAAAGDPRIKVLTKPNGGKGNALNYGIGRATSDLIFCMDADSTLSPGALQAGVRHMADPAVAAVAGSVFVLNQGTLLGGFQALEYLIGLNFYKAAQSYLGLVTIIPGPSGLFRKQVVQAIGGYKTDTFAEDCDITMRLIVEGHQVVYEAMMEVRTEVPSKLMELIKQRYRWNRGILQATRKHLPILLHFRSNPVGAMLILYMVVEAFILPQLNILVTILCLLYTAVAFDFSIASLWLAQLTMLDLSVVVFTMADLRWPFKLLPLALINRFSYAFFLDMIKVFSTIDEVLGVKMGWGKLVRTGEGA